MVTNAPTYSTPRAKPMLGRGLRSGSSLRIPLAEARRTLVAKTYANYREEDVGTSIISVRFTLNKMDAIMRK